MRSGSKRLMIGMGSLLIAAAMVAPSFAAKKAVSDEELDMVTAAGQPVVIATGDGSGGGGSLSVTFSATTDIASDLQAGSQTALRALILNNVVGENQVHNGLNVNALGGTGVAAASGQTNTITQSWGAIYDFSSVTADGASKANTDTCSSSALICKGTFTASGAPGFARALSKAADVVIHADGDATVTYNPTTQIASDIGDDSQSGLVALVVNNVAGLNQVANGINISGASISLTDNIAVGASGGPGVSQTNNIGQWRGTPPTALFRAGNP